MHCHAPVIAAASLMFVAACSSDPAKPVEDLGGGRNVAHFTLKSLRGTRDGDRLDVQAVFSGGSEGGITVDLHFRVTPPPHLESGTWSGLDSQGGVRERSSTFLGGQSGPPSIGGRFDLLGTGGQSLYRVTIPLQPLHDRL